MKLTIKEKKDNPLLHRIEISADLDAEGPTPSNQQIQKELASQLKADEKLIVVKHIYSQFGSDQADVLAYLYNDEVAMKRIEFIKEAKKPSSEGEKGSEKSEASSKPAEEKEAPAEEKKE